MVFVLCTAGTPVRVPMAGMYFSAVSKSGDKNCPKALAPTAPGKMFSAGTGRNDGANAVVPTWRIHSMAAILFSGKVPSIVAGAGCDALICPRIDQGVASGAG